MHRSVVPLGESPWIKLQSDADGAKIDAAHTTEAIEPQDVLETCYDKTVSPDTTFSVRKCVVFRCAHCSPHHEARGRMSPQKK